MSTEITYIGLMNPKSASNVGAIMRASGCFKVDEVCYQGSRFDHARKFATDTQLASKHIALVKVDAIVEHKPKDAKLICVELTVGATPLPEFEHPDQAFYVFGPEDGSISQQVIDQADEVIYIPSLNCLNLAATVNIVLYDRASKKQLINRSDEQIIRSRDRNNATKI